MRHYSLVLVRMFSGQSCECTADCYSPLVPEPAFQPQLDKGPVQVRKFCYTRDPHRDVEQLLDVRSGVVEGDLDVFWGA